METINPSKRTILLVEDEAIIALVEAHALEQCGYQVIKAHTGEAAVAIARERSDLDLVLMDIDLGPGMDGTEAAALILRERDVPVLFLSGHIEPEIVDKTELISSYGYVVKNSGTTVLHASIKMAFKLHQANAFIRSQNQDLEDMNARLEEAVEDLETANEELETANACLAESRKDLEASEYRFRLLYEHMGEGVALHDLVYDADGCPGNYIIRGVNPRFEEILGISAEAVVGKLATEVYGVDEAPFLSEYAEVARTAVPTQLESWVEPLGRCFSISVSPWGESGFATIFSDVTERKRTEAALTEERDKFSRILDAIPDGVYIVNAACDVQYVNPVIEREFGPVDGRKCFAYLHERTEACPWCKNEAVFSGQTVTWEWYSPKSGKNYILFDAPFRNADGSMSKIELFRDITEWRHDRIRLQESEEKYRTLVDHANEAIYVAQDGILRFVNRKCAEILGAPEKDLLGQPIAQFAMPEDLDWVDAHHRDILAGNILADHQEVQVRRQGKSPAWFLVNSVRIAWEGRPASLNLATDITTRKETENALRESERTIRRKLDEILTPVGDLGKLDLADVIDVEAVQALMDEFHRLTGIGVGILDNQGKVLVGTGWQEICVQYHRVHPETARHCLTSDTVLSQGAPPGEFRLYRCENHMWDIATPILVGGRHLGNLFLGQFLFEGETPDEDLFRAQAQRYGFDEREYLTALRRVPRWSRETVDAAMGFYVKLAELLSRLSFSNLRLARSVAEKAALMRELQHRAKNSLAMIAGLISLERNRVDDPSVSAILETLLGRVNSLARLNVLLLQGDYVSNVRLDQYFHALVQSLSASCVAGVSNIRICESYAPVTVGSRDAAAWGLILNELLTNALKHAFPGERSGIITVGLAQVDGHVRLEVADDGVGYGGNGGFPPVPGLGRLLVDQLVKQLGGTLSSRKGEGTALTVEAPLPGD